MKERQTKRPDVKKEFQQVRKEIKETEKRLEVKIDSKVDIATQSMKDYVDVKFSQVQSSIQLLGDKLDTSVKGMST